MPNHVCQMHAKRGENRNIVVRKWPCLDAPAESRKWLMAGYKHPRPSAKNKWRRFPLYKWWEWVEICTATPTESVLQASVSLSSQQCDCFLNIKPFMIMKMCFLSAPLAKTQNHSALGRNKWYRQDGLAMPVKHILLCKVFRRYQLWKESGYFAVNPNTAYYLLQSGILDFPFCCLHGIIGWKETHLIIPETWNSIILPQHLLIINALPNIQCFHWLKAHT